MSIIVLLLGTVLANEEVENGQSKEGGLSCRKTTSTSMGVKITAYAERLIRSRSS